MLYFYFPYRICIQIPVSSIMEHAAVRICLIMLKAVKFVDCCDGHLMLDSSLLLAGRTQLVMTMPWYGMIYITRPAPVGSKLNGRRLSWCNVGYNCRPCLTTIKLMQWCGHCLDKLKICSYWYNWNYSRHLFSQCILHAHIMLGTS